MTEDDLRFLSNAAGDVTAVVVPIELWRELAPEAETLHLLKSKAMRDRLLAARGRDGGIPLEAAAVRVGISLKETP